MKWTNKGHEFDEIGHLLHGKTKMLIYGAGQNGLEVYRTIISSLRRLKWEVTFIDADVEKQQGGYQGLEVMPPSAFASIDKENSFVVVCASENSMPIMLEYAERAGFEKDKNLFDHYYFLYTFLSVHFLYEFDMVYISSLNIVPSTICNLNCEGCLNFNPHIKKHTTYDLKSLKSDCDALFSKIDLIGRFQITGGEPLLYKHLKELIEYIGKNYRNKIVNLEIVTNGTVVPTDELCETMRRNKVLVYLDDYTNAVAKARDNFNIVFDMLKKYKVDMIHNYVGAWFNLTPDLEHPKQISEDELIAHCTHCACPWSTLSNRTISSCNYSLYAHKAGLIEYFEDEYLNLDSISQSNRAELVEFRLRYSGKGFVELCRSCAGFKGNVNFIEPAIQVPYRRDIKNELG